jgi:ribose transport system permease protein
MPDLARLRTALSFRNVSALYIFVLLFAVFSLWVPETFLRWDTWRSMLDGEALNALVAIGAVLPLAAGAFDLAIGAEVGIGAILVAWLLVKQGVPTGPAIAGALAAGGLTGVITGLCVVRARIDSFIASLAVGSVLTAMIQWVSGNQQILDVSPSFQRLGSDMFLGISYPVWFMLVVALVVWYLLERTPMGRRIYATGGNAEAARLAGVRTPLVIVGCLAACGLIAAMAGVLETARVGTGDPTVGPGFLLPAFAAVFLGSTQFRGGRFNVWGTVVAIYVLATGVKGLQLAGAPVWIPDLFNGLALLLAVGMAKYQGRSSGRMAAMRGSLHRGRARRQDEPAASIATPPEEKVQA